MKAKNLFGYRGLLISYIGVLILIILGSAVTGTIDHFIGVSFKDVGAVTQIIHKVTYMLWGGAILGMIKWFN